MHQPKLRPRFSFDASDKLLLQLHDAYNALTRSKRTVARNDEEYTELKKLLLAVGAAVNVEAMNPESSGPAEDARIEADILADQGLRGQQTPPEDGLSDAASVRPERFGFPISGQCGNPLGADSYCVREKHHSGLPCSPLEADANFNMAEEMWAEHEEEAQIANIDLDPKYKFFFLMGLFCAADYVSMLFRENEAHLENWVLLEVFTYDIEVCLDDETVAPRESRAKARRAKSRSAPKPRGH